MGSVPQQDVKELGTLKEQDILAIIGMCYETGILFFQLSDICTWVFLIVAHKKTDSRGEKKKVVNLNMQ